MTIRYFRENTEKIYGMAFVLANLFLVFSIVIFSIYLAAPLLGGKLSVDALIHYGSWIGLAIGMRLISKRGRKGLRIRAYEYSIACLVTIVNFALWFSYPMNVVLSVLCVVGMAISYRAQNKRINRDEKQMDGNANDKGITP
ncbi:MAG: hypothetical protein C4526_06565 [Nitrospiraceae bacterium]|nr:MAG: hypothetical protein C4526_06565 [Nitrospiraceae bacterium]